MWLTLCFCALEYLNHPEPLFTGVHPILLIWENSSWPFNQPQNLPIHVAFFVNQAGFQIPVLNSSTSIQHSDLFWTRWSAFLGMQTSLWLICKSQRIHGTTWYTNHQYMRSHQIWGQTSLPNKIFETTNYSWWFQLDKICLFPLTTSECTSWVYQFHALHLCCDRQSIWLVFYLRKLRVLNS